MAGIEHPERDEVQGHSRMWSDETLKQAVAKVEDALASLRELPTSQGQDDEDEVQGYARVSAGRGLEQPIGSLQRALATLRPGTASSR